MLSVLPKYYAQDKACLDESSCIMVIEVLALVLFASIAMWDWKV